MSYKFFTNSERAWAAMYEAMSEARESIYFEMYIFVDDIRDFDFMKLLIEKALSGVKIKMILDSYGSSDLSDEAILSLRDAGVEVLFFSHFLHRTHRKILIVDSEVAFVGGVNFKQSMHSWKDMMVRVRGRLVRNIIRSFAKAYVKANGKDPTLVLLNKKVTTNKAKSWLMEHFPVSNKSHLKKLYQQAFRDAEEKVTLVTPYFSAKRWLIGAMHQAVLRGVHVEVLVPEHTESFFLDRLNYFYINKVSKLGVKFYIQPKMNHAKVLVVDHKEGMVGSNNLDVVSFEYNSEIGVFIKDEVAIKKLLLITDEWKKHSSLFNPKSYKPELLDYIISPILRLLFFV